MTDPMPPLVALRAFEASARRRSFAAAARELNVTQSAVAQQVRRLEATLGVRLFERRARGLTPTEAGRAYRSAIAQAFEIIADATRRVAPSPSRVVISVTPSFASKWLLPRLATFNGANPEIDLHVLATETRSSFRADGVDLIVRQAAPPFGSGLTIERLYENRVVAVCRPALRDALEGLGLAQALKQAVLLHDAHNLWPRFLAETSLESDHAPMSGMTFSQTALAIDAAIAGQGVALASHCLVETELRDGRLTLFLEKSIQLDVAFYVLAPKNRGADSATEATRRWLLAERDAANATDRGRSRA